MTCSHFPASCAFGIFGTVCENSCLINNLNFQYNIHYYLSYKESEVPVPYSQIPALERTRISSDIFTNTGLRPATSWGVHYTTSCNTQSSAPEDG